MGRKKVVIAGAGIAGLSLGCYLQMNGFDTEIYEANGWAGGLCAGWERNGYKIDGCLRGLLGSGPRHPFYKLYSELIDMDRLEFLHPEIKNKYEFADGSCFVEYTDLKELEKYMLKLAPEDEPEILEWIGDIRKIEKIKLPLEKPRELYGFPERLRAGKGATAALLKKWGNMTAEEFAGRFKNKLLAHAAGFFESPVLNEMIALAALDMKSNGYPVCGSDGFARMIEDKYIALGGKVHYMSRVQKIHVEKRNAWGITLEGGRDARGDIIVSAMDGRSTIFDLLGGKFINADIRSFYENADLGPSMIQVSIGLNKKLDNGFIHSNKISFDVPYELPDGSRHSFFEVMRIPQMVDQEKTLLRVQMDTKHSAYWGMLRKAERERYRKEKSEIAAWVAGVIDSRVYPIAGDVEMMNVTTPATYIRLTGNWRGAVMGWGKGNLLKENPFDKELPGLKNFYMAGQWVQPGGGVPLAFKSARDLAQLICREEKKEFAVK